MNDAPVNSARCWTGSTAGRSGASRSSPTTPACCRSIVEQEDATLRALDAEAASASAGRAYLIARKRDRLLAAAAAQHAAESVRDILERLAALSVAVAQDQPGPAQPGAEQLACKAAFLIDESALTTFHDAVIDLERRFSPRGLRLEVSGPWAPYSFVRPRDTGDV